METYILDNILKMHFTTTEQEMAVQRHEHIFCAILL